MQGWDGVNLPHVGDTKSGPMMVAGLPAFESGTAFCFVFAKIHYRTVKNNFLRVARMVASELALDGCH